MQLKHKLFGINFFLADVRDGLGPFLAVYLISTQHWKSDQIGFVMTVSGLMTLLFQIPAGAMTDATRNKRSLFALSCTIIAIAMLVIQFFPSYSTILVSKIFLGMAAAFILPLVSAISLGVVGVRNFPKQVAMNEAFNHTGNVFAALMVIVLVNTLGLSSMFSFTAIMAFFAIVFVFSIHPRSINHEVARGLSDKTSHQPGQLSDLIKNRPLLLFGICCLLFHLANAAMLVLIGEEIALKSSGENSVSFLALSIISAQFVMFLMAILTQKKVDSWGRKPLFLIAFTVLPLRGVLFNLSADPKYLLAIQLLDGVGAGLFGALFPIVIADFTKGSGHYNLALSVTSALQGIGASLSTLLSGYIVAHFGFSMAFWVLAAIAMLALLCFALGVCESRGYVNDTAIH